MYRMHGDNPPKKTAIKKWKKLEEKHAETRRILAEYRRKQELKKLEETKQTNNS